MTNQETFNGNTWDLIEPLLTEGPFTAEVLRKTIEIGNNRNIDLVLALGDITSVDCDAIVVPSNPGYVYVGSMSGGVQAAVYRKFGEKPFLEAAEKASNILDDVQLVGEGSNSQHIAAKKGLPFGTALVTDTFHDDRIKNIVHINSQVGLTERADFDTEIGSIIYAVKGALKSADQAGIRSIALPTIDSSPMFGGISLPKSLNAVVNAIKQYFAITKDNTNLEKVVVVAYFTPTERNIQGLMEFIRE